jgi:hypothetical protein
MTRLRNMKTAGSVSSLVRLALLVALGSVGHARSPGVDAHTVALWLFDEPTYPNVVLTDASRDGSDLRLQAEYDTWYVRTEGSGDAPAKPLHVEGKYGLIPGKFGRALYVPQPSIARITWVDNRGRYGSGSMMPTGTAVPERLNLGYFDWTVEFWFRAAGPQTNVGTILELRNETDQPRGQPMESALRLAPGRDKFFLISRTLLPPERNGMKGSFDLELAIPTDPGRLNDGAWHHLAFGYESETRQLRHYVDGQIQPLPKKGGFLPMVGTLTSLELAANVQGLLDEFRISDVLRYREAFPPPESFSRNYGTQPAQVNRAHGPPLLFPGNRAPSTPTPLGSRKHVLIDDVLVESLEHLTFRPQPPESRQVTDFRNTQPWEAAPRMGSTIPDVCTVWDEGHELRMLYTNNGMFSGKPTVVCLAVSKDGLHWEKPVLGIHPWEGTLATNIVLRHATQGSVIKDNNPATPPAERYKYVTYSIYRGYYVFTSPDGIHFERNETVGLPFDTDGSNTFYWDDQQGLYRVYVRCVSVDRAIRRRVGHVEVADLFKPWPFKPVDEPFIDDLMLGRPALGELPVIDAGGQIYRLKAHKYDWAPDVYVAFPWRYLGGENIRPGSFLMVSRDGTTWRRYEDPYYFPSGWDLNGRKVLEALSEHGLIRRGSEIWQYGTVRFTEHGGAILGGVEHEGGVHDRLLRLVQRLDGFVAVVPTRSDRTPGVMVTRPFTFTGDRLELNLDASGGSARMALLNEDGTPIEGFDLGDCQPLRENGTGLAVTWRSDRRLADLSGRPVRLKVELVDAKLFAFQFL